MDEEIKIPEVVTEEPKPNIIQFQHVIITLADGRRGVFYGPALIKEIEMKLNMVPKLVSIDFDPPKAVAIPQPKEETPNADSQVVETAAPDAGLEQKA
jgi:hypothetical protein